MPAANQPPNLSLALPARGTSGLTANSHCLNLFIIIEHCALCTTFPLEGLKAPGYWDSVT